MSAGITSAPVAVLRPGRARADRGLFRAKELSETTLLVAVTGEIDAANSGELRRYVEHHVTDYRQLVLDLSRLDFFAADGFSVLDTVNLRLSLRAIDWVLVPGPEVSRVLRVCDPEGTLATATNIVSAVAALARRPHQPPRLTPVPN